RDIIGTDDALEARGREVDLRRSGAVVDLVLGGRANDRQRLRRDRQLATHERQVVVAASAQRAPLDRIRAAGNRLARLTRQRTAELVVADQLAARDLVAQRRIIRTVGLALIIGGHRDRTRRDRQLATHERQVVVAASAQRAPLDRIRAAGNRLARLTRQRTAELVVADQLAARDLVAQRRII